MMHATILEVDNIIYDETRLTPKGLHVYLKSTSQFLRRICSSLHTIYGLKTKSTFQDGVNSVFG